MTDRILQKLPDILKSHTCTMERASLDKSRSVTMSDSKIKVVNFDKIPKEYSKGRSWSNMPSSNDALYITVDGKWYFIEFKNGSVEKASIYRKLYDSIIMMIDMGIMPDFQFARESVHYILIYNAEKYSKIEKSESRNENYSYIMNLAKTEEKLFDVDKLEDYLIKEAHTYTKELFKTYFTDPMENQEEAAI